jgi:hypothetical protein
MTNDQRQIAQAWFEAGLLDSPDVWPFTRMTPEQVQAKQRKQQAETFRNLGDALI